MTATFTGNPNDNIVHEITREPSGVLLKTNQSLHVTHQLSEMIEFTHSSAGFVIRNHPLEEVVSLLLEQELISSVFYQQIMTAEGKMRKPRPPRDNSGPNLPR